MGEEATGRWSDGLATAVVVGLAVATLRQGVVNDFGYNLFSDRDLARGARLWEVFDPTGPELSGGGGARLPGWLVSVVYGAPQWVFGPGARGAFVVTMGMLAAAAVVGHRAVAARGAWAGVIAAALLVSHPAQRSVVQDLWNPGLLALPAMVAAAAVVRLAASPSAGAVAWWVGGTMLAAQAHASAWLWGAMTLPAVVWLAWGRAGWGTAAGVAVALNLPYLVSEALNGQLNTARMFDQHATERGGWSVERLGQVVGWLVRPPDELGAVGWASSLVLLGAAVVGVGLIARERRQDPAGWRAAVALASGVVGTALALGTTALPYMTARYVAVLAPPLALLGALGAHRLARLGGPGAVVVGLALVVRSPVLAAAPGGDDPKGHRAVMAALDQAQARTGWDLPTLADRTVWRLAQQPDRPEDGLMWPAVAHLVSGAPAALPADAPCALLLRAGWTEDTASVVTPDLVRRHLRLVGEVGIVDVVALDGPWTLVQYRAPGQRCPSSMSQRYVDTPVEAALHTRWGTSACGEVWPVPGGAAAKVDVAHDGVACAPIAVAVTLSAAGDEVEATLHSNQLRGAVDNGGWFASAIVERPAVVLRDTAGAELRLGLAEGRVGGWYAPTPLTARASGLGAGPYEVWWVARALRLRPDQDPAAAEGRDVAVRLMEAWRP